MPSDGVLLDRLEEIVMGGVADPVAAIRTLIDSDEPDVEEKLWSVARDTHRSKRWKVSDLARRIHAVSGIRQVCEAEESPSCGGGLAGLGMPTAPP